MALRDTVGTPRQVIISGTPCDAHTDCDISQVLNEWEKELKATSGRPMVQMTKKIMSAKSIDLAVSPDVADLLAVVADSPVALPMGFVTAGAVTYMGTGHIKLGEYSHYNGKLPVEIHWETKPTKV